MGRDWSQALAKLTDEPQCRVCSRGDTLDPAHIVDRSLGGSEDYANIVPLCRRCHHKYDSHELDLLPYLSNAEQQKATELLGLANAYNRTTV